MATAARRIILNVPMRLMLITRENDASACGPSFFTVRSAMAMPAQFTKPCKALKFFSAASIAAWPSVSLVTSHLTNRALAPSCFASASPLSAWRSAITALAPASTSILTVPSPRPDAPPVTINVLPLSCMASTSTFLRRFFLFRHQSWPIAQERIQAVLCDQISPALEFFLAFRLLEELLAAFLELLVVLRLVFGFLAFRGRARLARFAGDGEADVIIVAHLVADPESIGKPVEGLGLDDDRMIEPGVALGGIGDHIDEIHPTERAGEVGRLLQIGPVLRAGEFPVGRFGVACHAPARLAVFRRRNRLHAVGSNQILHQPLIGPGADFAQRLADREHRAGIAAQRQVTARRLGLSPRKRRDRRALHDFLSEKQPSERAALGVLQLDRRSRTLRPVLRLEELQASALALGQGLALHDLQFGELHQKAGDTIRVGRETGALAHAPAGLASGEVQLARGIPDRDLGDLAQAQARYRLLPGAGIGARPGRALGQDDGGTQRGEDRQRCKHDKELLAVHRAGVLRRRRTASAMPASATRIGINAMFATLVQNWSASLSARSSRRTSFSTRRVSAAFLRKFSSSLCCSAVRIAPAPCPLPFCSAFNFSCVWPRLSSSSLILPR